MPRQREEILNAELGKLLIARHPSWSESNVHIDSTHTIRGQSGLKIDVLVENPVGQPVAMETKFDASRVGTALREQVEDRIGLTIDQTGSVIESGISVVYPPGLTGSGVAGARLRYAVHQLAGGDTVTRWPERDDEWIEGSVDDLADAVEVVSLSEKRIREGEQLLSHGVQDASSLLEALGRGTAFGAAIAEVLHQEQSQQTTRMSVAIVVNAFVFHYAIEGQADIPPVSGGSGRRGFVKSRVLKTWETILEVNYWPIFSIAKDVLEVVPARLANPLLDKAHEVAEELLTVGATTFHDLAARMFQTLISDRKFLATFYTLPESACLLAELAVSRLEVDWTDAKVVQALKIADFACGTGTLLSATQGAIYRRLRRAGFDDADWHRVFMERVLLGTDIMPSAAHLTASMLSSAHPAVGYVSSLVRVLPFGVDEELSKLRSIAADTPYIGALDLRMAEFGHSLFTQGGLGPQVEIGGRRMTAKGAKDVDTGREFPVEHASFDLVIMNPPFTRPTGHEAGKIGVPVPSFAGFDTSKDEQFAMSRKLRAQSKLFGHGNAGLASEFMDLAHDKLKPGGVLALVLPFSFASGQAWSRARDALSRWYRDIQVVSIATAGTTAQSFSADTGMAECLVLATRAKSGGFKRSSPAVRYANLVRRPRTLLEAHESAKRIQRGATIKGTFRDSGAAGIQDADVGDVLTALRKGQLHLPRVAKAHPVPITEMRYLADRGLYHMDINGAGQRGAFDIRQGRGRGVPTYPVLWSHDADRERRLVVEPDSRGVVRPGMRDQAEATWAATASRLHHNVDFRLNSQSHAACLTDSPCIGGRAWPNLLPHDERYEIPLILWSNTTLGLMLYWWCGVRPQMGRASLKITAVPSLPTLDARALKKAQQRQLDRLFADFEGRAFLPANEAYRDDVRAALDARVLGVLGLRDTVFDSLELVRLKWCSEPSVHGGKHTRPEDA